MGKKPITAAAFEIGPETLKFVEMTVEDRRVLSVGFFPLALNRWRDGEHLAAQIRSALDTNARGQVKRLIASVPLGHAWLRAIDVPGGADVAEMREHIEWDLSRYLGRDLNDDLVDIQDIQPRAESGFEEGHQHAGSQRRVAAVFGRGDALLIRDALEAGASLPLTALDIDAAALVNVFNASNPELRSDRTLLIQANIASTALIGVRGGEFQGAVVRHDAGDSLKAGADAQDRAEGLLRVARGIAETLSIGPEDSDKPDHILLSGDLASDSDFRELLRAHLPVPFGLLNPFRNIPGPDPADQPEAYPGGPLAATIGLALRLTEES